MTEPSSETLHATTVSIGGRAVLITGRSGSGKSDLALRLIDRGARLVSDDYTIVKRIGGVLSATAPSRISGKMEVRGIGIVAMEPSADVPVSLAVDLDRAADRMPEPGEVQMIAGIAVRVIALDARESSAPMKVEWALKGIMP